MVTQSSCCSARMAPTRRMMASFLGKICTTTLVRRSIFVDALDRGSTRFCASDPAVNVTKANTSAFVASPQIPGVRSHRPDRPVTASSALASPTGDRLVGRTPAVSRSVVGRHGPDQGLGEDLFDV
jgi:hypothetical protein